MGAAHGVHSAVLIAVITVGVGYATALLFTALGELLAEQSGVINLGLEGLMLIGAVTAFWIPQVVSGASWLVLLLAILAAMCASGLAAALFAIVCVVFQGSQVVTGLAIAILGGITGVSTLAAAKANLSNAASKVQLGRLDLFGLRHVPVLGPVLFNYDILVYVSWLVAIAVALYLNRTHAGLRLRAVGEAPAAAEAVGIGVVRVRIAHIVMGGALAGVGGAYYTLALVPNWANGMTAGAGFVALGLVIVAAWRPGRLVVAAYIFGMATSAGATFQAHGWNVPPELVSSFPYLATLLILVGGSIVARRRPSSAPAALGENYTRN